MGADSLAADSDNTRRRHPVAPRRRERVAIAAQEVWAYPSTARSGAPLPASTNAAVDQAHDEIHDEIHYATGLT